MRDPGAEDRERGVPWRSIGGAGQLARRAGIGGVIVTLILLAALLAPWLAPRAPDAIDLGQRLAPPSWSEPFGTDAFGRSVISRVMYGARVSLLVALAVVTVGGGIGALLGIAAGYVGGTMDRLSMRVVDVLLSFPPLLLALAVVGVFGPGLAPTVLALTLVEIPIFARLARSAVLPVRDAPYVEAARALGAPERRTLVRYVLPSVTGMLAAHASVASGYALLALAGLSFLGLGVQPPTPDWGAMIAESRTYLVGSPSAPWLLAFPSLAVAVAVLGFLLVGDAALPHHADDHLGRSDTASVRS